MIKYLNSMIIIIEIINITLYRLMKKSLNGDSPAISIIIIINFNFKFKLIHDIWWIIKFNHICNN